ncbi:hydroxymethylbilane synthase [Klugiella xanthotipulae]|uniref:Hydroxymethylbilane synthase n=1 Tax=Klugiella xanthotipulae TaxID=244735 RepID=A0A543I5X4_9MICO|nr:hydroxymethylbilane synthase [Klugiella xanthotipulae]TQM65995.1 hydroxymethylbilane synthase [Klugiella xanthotipulae]
MTAATETLAPGAPLRLGTRASALATTQSRQVADRITELTGHPVELVHITTHGDVTRASLSSLGGTGVFATALRDALLRGECDLVVHSLKDLPTAPCPGLEISGIPLRADARDALCARDGFTLYSLPEGARVGTGSPRRIAQLYAARPDLTVIDIRGNIDTRLGRIEDDLDAVLLAAAGLGRLGRTDAITQLIDLAEWPTAPGQGALALESREGSPVSAALAALDDPHTRNSITAERAVLNALEAGCAAPVGVSTLATSTASGRGHSVTAQVYSLDGMESLTVTRELPGVLSAQALLRSEELGRDIARELLDRGAATLAPLGR